jgi:hypothetical protein
MVAANGPDDLLRPTGGSPETAPGRGPSAPADRVDRLLEGVDNDRRVGIAIGICMSQSRITEAEAMRMLVDLSQERQMELGALAEQLIQHQMQLCAEQASRDNDVSARPDRAQIPRHTPAPMTNERRWWG